MARIRTIKPEFWEDEKIGLLSHGARLLFLGSLNLADDEGLIRWNEMYLGSSIFPYDDIKPETVTKWMQELTTNELIFPYMGGQTKQRLGWIVNFHKHQRIDKPQPSRFAAPSLQNADVKTMYFKRDGGKCGICGGEILIESDNNRVGSKALSLDHLKHRIRGGDDVPSNIRAVHLGCNKSRGSRENASDDYVLNHSENDSGNDSTTEWNGKGKEQEGNGARNGMREGFEKKFLVPEIISVYAEVFPDYIRDRDKDPKSALKIFEIITQNANIEQVSHDEVKDMWRNICHALRDKESVQFYSGNGLSTIANSLPTIIQKIRNGNRKTGKQTRQYTAEDFAD